MLRFGAGRFTLDDHDAADFLLRRRPVASVTSARDFDAVRHQVLFCVVLADGPLQCDDDFGPLFHEFLLALLDDERVGVAHHGDQHVQQQDRHHNHEDDENELRHGRVDRLAQRRILADREETIKLW